MITVLVLEGIVFQPHFYVKMDIMSVITLQTAILMKHAAGKWATPGIITFKTEIHRNQLAQHCR